MASNFFELPALFIACANSVPSSHAVLLRLPQSFVEGERRRDTREGEGDGAGRDPEAEDGTVHGPGDWHHTN